MKTEFRYMSLMGLMLPIEDHPADMPPSFKHRRFLGRLPENHRLPVDAKPGTEMYLEEEYFLLPVNVPETDAERALLFSQIAHEWNGMFPKTGRL